MERVVSELAETEEEVNRRHNEKMARRKAARERMLATKTEERGLLIVHTGKGKGKSTAAFGMVLRCLGHGMRVGIVQFVKGVWSTGERVALEPQKRGDPARDGEVHRGEAGHAEAGADDHVRHRPSRRSCSRRSRIMLSSSSSSVASASPRPAASASSKHAWALAATGSSA